MGFLPCLCLWYCCSLILVPCLRECRGVVCGSFLMLLVKVLVRFSSWGGVWGKPLEFGARDY
jgi:hypothetical protein